MTRISRNVMGALLALSAFAGEPQLPPLRMQDVLDGMTARRRAEYAVEVQRKAEEKRQRRAARNRRTR